MQFIVGKNNTSETNIAIGSIHEGKVIAIKDYGVFVRFGKNQIGMVHISEVSNGYVKNINDHLKIGDRIIVEVISVNNGKISLRRMLPKKDGREIPNNIKTAQKKNKYHRTITLDEQINKFKADSEEKLKSVRVRAEKKGRSNGGYNNNRKWNNN
ncbi:MAG: S1 RNA-binding domain-containing protein [Clostridiales bacterium]|jgi:S1 RNA binding domain protein|nr:S1 RNA-binding domain-containing protein [Clostridiales bacterium]